MLWAIMLVVVLCGAAAQPLYEAELIFPAEKFHNHSSTIVETPQGDLLAAWFHGKGERNDDTLVISGARKKKGATTWSAPFLMADNKNLPEGAVFTSDSMQFKITYAGGGGHDVIITRQGGPATPTPTPGPMKFKSLVPMVARES